MRLSVPDWMMRRLWWRAFGHGSGKKMRTPSRDSSPNMRASTSTPSPRTIRMLSMPPRTTAPSNFANPGLYSSTATTLVSASSGAIAAVEVPVPEPISTMVGWPARPNQPSISMRSSEPSASTLPRRGQCSLNRASWLSVSVPRRNVTDPKRG